VVRYFGGTKLGVGGLIQAYKTTAAITLEQAGRKRIWITEQFKVLCDYPHLNEVMRLIKREKLTVVEQVLDTRCRFVLEVKKDQAEDLVNTIEAHQNIRVERL
jgi:putative IMPACT (imprinted ancient) family translation regulator